MQLIRTLTVDPGMNTGWAFWDGHIIPKATGVFRIQRIKKSVISESAQLQELWMQFKNILEFFNPQLVIIENTSWWPGSVKSFAAINSGDLRKLTLLTGGYCLYANIYDAEWELVIPSKWKGQLTDKALKAHIKLKIHKEYRQHEQEAVGIGLWKSGILC